MPNQNHFEDEVINLMGVITKMVEDQDKQGNDSNLWLRTLYEKYMERFLYNNDKIFGNCFPSKKNYYSLVAVRS